MLQVRRQIGCMLLSVVLVLGFESLSSAFEIDTHYYLTFGLALGTCFDWDEAHLIASANLMIDQNSTTIAERNPFQSHNKRRWHAFGHSEDDFNDLWFRAVRETDPQLQLVKLGQFLHFLQDWEPHTGFPLTLGHGVATITGRDPDSLVRTRERTSRMLQATLDHLAKMCEVLGRLPEGIEDADLSLISMTRGMRDSQVLTDLMQASSPRWRRPWGKISRRGLKIVAQNQLRMEQYIDRQIRLRPGKKVPSDFRPGDEEHGIPPPIPLRFDRDGELTEGLERAIATAKELDAKNLDLADDDITLLQAVREEAGWRVGVQVQNLGDLPSQAGALELNVVDALNKALLGEESRQIPSLQPGQTITIEALIPTSCQAKEELLSIRLNVGDLSMYNDQLWFMSKQDRAELEADLEAQGRPPDGTLVEPPVDAVAFVGTPKLKLYGKAWLIVVLTARTNLRDPSEEMAVPTVRLRHANVGLTPDETFDPQVWSISVLGEGVRPAAKMFMDLKVSEICAKGLPDTSPPVLDFTVVADDQEARTSVAFDDVLAERLRWLCSHAGQAVAPRGPSAFRLPGLFEYLGVRAMREMPTIDKGKVR
jgi:hypothetical protein